MGNLLLERNKKNAESILYGYCVETIGTGIRIVRREELGKWKSSYCVLIRNVTHFEVTLYFVLWVYQHFTVDN